MAEQIALSDLKQGMYLTVDMGQLTVYDRDLTTVKDTLPAGSLIGQIMDFQNTNIEWVIFANDAFYDASSILEKVENVTSLGIYVNTWGYVKFTDLQQVVNPSDIQAQRDLMAKNAADGDTLENIIKSGAEKSGKIIAAAAGGLLSGVGGWLLLAGVLFVGYQVITHSSYKSKSFSYKS